MKHEDINHAGITGVGVATDPIFNAAGDLVVGTGADTATRLAIGTNGQVLKSNGTTAVWGTDAGLLDTGTITYLDATEAAAPSTPASGKVRIYAKDGRIYSKDDAGTEYGPFDAAGGGGGGPLLAVDDIALDANGTDFASMSGWTAIGTASAGAGTPNDYDTDVQDIALPAQGDGYHRAYPGDGVTCYLTVHNTVQIGGMLCLAFTDGSGNGRGVGLYNDTNVYTWVISGNAYSANDGVVSLVPSSTASTCATSYILRLSRSGSTVTTAISWDGGKTWLTDTTSDATSYSRVAILRLHTTGGTANVLTVGRYNEV